MKRFLTIMSFSKPSLFFLFDVRYLVGIKELTHVFIWIGVHYLMILFTSILGLEDGAIGQLGENVQEPVGRVLNFVADNVTTPDLHMEVNLALVTEKNTDFAVLVIIFNIFLLQDELN